MPERPLHSALDHCCCGVRFSAIVVSGQSLLHYLQTSAGPVDSYAGVMGPSARLQVFGTSLGLKHLPNPPALEQVYCR